MNKLVIENQIKFHLDKIKTLEHTKEMKKSTGEKKLWKMEQLLHGDLQALDVQIKNHEKKIKELQDSLTT